MEAYELLLRANWHLYRRTAQDIVEARRFTEAAAEKDPTYAAAHAGLAFLKYHEASKSFADRDYLNIVEESLALAEHALELDPFNPRALTYCAHTHNRLGNHQLALETVNRSIALCPSFYQSHTALAYARNFLGHYSDAKRAADETIRLRPRDPLIYRCIISKSIAEYQTKDFDRAAHIARVSLRTEPSWWNSQMLLAASLAQSGETAEAGEVVDKMHQDFPGLKLEHMLRRMPFAVPEHSEHLAEGMMRAGWRD